MEIKFDNVSYFSKRNKKEMMNCLNLQISSKKIVALIIDEFSLFYDLLTVEKRPYSGKIIFDDVVISRSNHVENLNVVKNKIGIVGSVVNIKYEKTVKDQILREIKTKNVKVSSVNKHLEDSLKLVSLTTDFLKRDPKTLSSVELKKVMLASVLACNPEVLVLYNFEKGLTYRDKEYFRKLFLKLKNKFNKTVILITDKVEFLFDLVDELFVVKSGKIVLELTDNIFYNDELYKYVDIPKIVEFTKYVNSTGNKILEYTDLKELIKEIYRKVKR